MTVATRNTKHFEFLGVPCLNPWGTDPPAASDLTADADLLRIAGTTPGMIGERWGGVR